MPVDEHQMERWLVETRRDFHMHPEISNQEHRTTQRILEILHGFGVEARRLEGMTGAVGLIRGAQPGRTIALRADIDALPVQELNEVPYRSTREGVMHACGHDAHTTVMLGVAKSIMESGLASRLRGNAVFLFQPAEERVTGAREMIARGVLEDPRVDWVIAGHVVPDLPAGTVGLFRAQSHASADRFSVFIQGKGAHGGRPNEGVDPIVAGAYFVTAVQSILGRNVKPTEPAVVTIGKFVAGTVGNVIPDRADLEGTIRALSSEVRSQLMERLVEVREGMDRTFGVRSTLEFQEGVPVCVNDEGVSAFLHQAAVDLLSEENVRYLQPSMGAEDFALFAEKRPSSIVRLGCGWPGRAEYSPLHSPHFDIDERALTVGVRLFTEAVKRYLV
jgi:amidohydrolase